MKSCLYTSGLFTCSLLVMSCLPVHKLQAQASFDLYGIAPISTICQSGGGGFGIMSEPYIFGRKKSKRHVEVRIGGDFYISGLSYRKFQNVYVDPQSYGPGELSLRNTLFSMDTRLRISGSSRLLVIPYIDLFGGFSDFYSGLNYQSNDFKHNLSQSFYSSTPFSYGANAGFMISLSKNVKLDFGFGYTALNRAKTVDFRSAHMESNTLVANRMDLPYGMFTARAGVNFMFDVTRRDFRDFDWTSLLFSSHSHSHSCGGGLVGGLISAVLR